MQQMTLVDQTIFEQNRKKSRREQFLEEIGAVMPWADELFTLAPYYSKGEMGRKRVRLAIMERVNSLQVRLDFSDPAAEHALYESTLIRRSAGIDLGQAPAADEMAILNFRHLLQEHELCGQMLDTVNFNLESKGICLL